MEENISFYLEKNNSLFKSDVLVVCYKATKNEIEHIASDSNGFFEIWTLKEAYFKCIGTGLGADIKDVSFEITENEIRCSEDGFEFSFINQSLSPKYLENISIVPPIKALASLAPFLFSLILWILKRHL